MASTRTRCCCLGFLVTTTIFLIIGTSILAGGVLNRIRGGYLNVSDDLPAYNTTAGYWQAHVVTRLVFAVPVGLMTGLVGWHAKGGLVTGITTWFSLYIGWGCYMYLGEDANGYLSRSGVFDWILGRQLEGWPYARRVIRDYTGMSLRGLAWTAPTGYALYYMGYGWQYALAGSLMAVFYFAGAHTHIRSSALENDFGAGVPASEFYWGAFIWLALAFSAIARITEHFLKKWEREARRRDRASDAYPRPSYKRSRWTKAKFGRKASAIVYELTMGAINCVFAASVVFYALVAQDDVRNKGQTFFGIFTAFVFLLTCQTFTMGRAWTLARVRKATAAAAAKERRRSSAEVRAKISVASRNHFSRTNSMGAPDPFGAPFLGRTIVPVDEALPTYQEIESMEEAPRVITINDEESGDEDYSGLRAYRAGIEPERPKSFAWDFVEILHMAAGWIRNLVGLLGMVATCVTFLLCLFAAAWNAHTPRFIQTNSTTCEQASLYEIFSGMASSD